MCAHINIHSLPQSLSRNSKTTFQQYLLEVSGYTLTYPLCPLGCYFTQPLSVLAVIVIIISPTNAHSPPLLQKQTECMTSREFLASLRSSRQGDCPPPQRATGFAAACVESCSSDQHCPSSRKCCFNGCGHTCQAPANLCKGKSNSLTAFFSISSLTTGCYQGFFLSLSFGKQALWIVNGLNYLASHFVHLESFC